MAPIMTDGVNGHARELDRVYDEVKRPKRGLILNAFVEMCKYCKMSGLYHTSSFTLHTLRFH